ncbi:MAG: transposase [Lachnospiraceae bacterium]|nr:transposase [Lachnospiraceae bacterium]
MASKKYNLSELKINRLNWKKVLEDALSHENKEIFLNRKNAVDMYIDGVNVTTIEAETRIDKATINKLVAKCCKINPITNEPYGYAALIPYFHIEKYKRVSNSSGTTSSVGLFELLLEKYPILDTFIADNYFGNKEITLEKNMRVTTLHNKFLYECRNLGIQDYEYPFNTESRGLRSLRRYVQKLKHQNEKLSIKREGKDARQKFQSTGKGHKNSTIPMAPYSLVQLDGHKIDMLYTVPVLNSDGSISNLPATRLWLIAVIDVATRTILGYSLSSEENYNQTDVLAAIKDSIQPRKRIEFTIHGFHYPADGGFPCFAIEETNWAILDAIMLDNAKAHLAHDVVCKITEKLMCAINFGSVATPETRGIVERFFGTLEENGYHRVPSTTGSNTRDVRRENAEKDAINYNITYNDLVELTEYLIATYNNSSHSALSGRTPIQVMNDRIKNAGMIPCIADNKMKEAVGGLTNLVVERTVRGAFSSGKRPYISYEGVEYRNEAVSISTHLVGTKLLLEVNPDDISSLLAYTEDGIELGYLRATGIWGRRSHSLKTRKEALKYIRKNKSENSPFFASLIGYENELRNRAAQSRSARTKIERMRREQENSINTHISDAKDNNGNQSKVLDFEQLSKKENKAMKQIHEKKEYNQPADYVDDLDGISFEEAYKRGLFK